MQSRRSTLFVIFLLLLLIPGASSLLAESVARTSLKEARKLAEPLRISTLVAQPLLAPSELDRFFQDHLGLRSELLEMNGRVRSLLAAPASSDVVIGKDGWMFLAQGLIGRERRNKRLARRIDAHADYLSVLDQLAHAKGAQFAVLVAPDKHTIYPRMLPPWIDRSPSVDAYSAFLEALRSRQIATADVRPALVKESRVSPAYFRTDTHWTPFGANTALAVLLDEIGVAHDIDTEGLSHHVAAGKGGDLFRIALFSGQALDYVVSGQASSPTPSYRTTRLVRQGDTKPGYIAETGKPGPTILVIGDSFSREFLKEPLLKIAGKVVWVHHNFCAAHAALLEEHRADLVIYEVVERYIGCKPGADQALRASVSRVEGA